MATNIPPHNMGDIVDAIIHLADNPEATVEELMEFVKGPDFLTGGAIYGIEQIKKNIYQQLDGGRVIIRGIAEITET